MTTLLNLVVAGLLVGVVAAAAVSLLARRWPRFAALAGTVAFPMIAIAPLFRSANDLPVPIDSRRADSLVFVIFCLVALVLIARDLCAHFVSARDRVRWTPAPVELRQSLGVDGLFVSPDQPPSTHGVFTRAIVIPSIHTHAAVLLHERAHWIWRDPALGAARRFLRATFWMHPGVWLLERAIRQATELAADAEVIRATDPSDRAAFASLLISMSREVSAGTAFGAFGARHLEERVRTILGCPSRRLVAANVFLLFLALVSLHFVPTFIGGEAATVIIDVIVR